MLKRPKFEHVLFSLTFLALCVILAYPLLKIIGQAFTYDGRLSLRSIFEMWRSSSNRLAMKRSLAVSLWSTLFSVILGVSTAWIVTRTNVPFKNTLKSMLMAPFLIPPFVGAMAWVQLLGPVGYVNKILMGLFSREEPLFSIYGPVGIVLVLVLHGYSTVFLITCAAFEKMDSSLEEAALMCGAKKRDIMADITLPIMAPAILGVALISFSQSITNFGVPAVLGLPARYLVFTTKIFSQINSFGNSNNFSYAGALSLELVVISTTALLLQKLYLGKKQYAVITGKSAQPQVLDLGKARYALAGFIVLIFAMTTVAPIIAILLSALVKTVGVSPVPSNWTLANFKYVLFESQTTVRAIKNSLFLGVVAATATTLLGASVSYFSVKSRIKGRHAIEFIGSMGQAVPGIVLGLGVILAWIRPVAGLKLYNTIWIIAIAYVANYLALSVRSAGAAFAQIHDSLEEAARMAGAKWGDTIRDIVFPLVSPSLIAGWMLVFMPAIRELNVSILLWSAGHETIGVSVLNMSDGGQFQYSSAMGIVLMVIIFMGNFAIRKLTRGKYGF